VAVLEVLVVELVVEGVVGVELVGVESVGVGLVDVELVGVVEELVVLAEVEVGDLVLVAVMVAEWVVEMGVVVLLNTSRRGEVTRRCRLEAGTWIMMTFSFRSYQWKRADSVSSSLIP
jgi:putative protein kinase ArgK-like GTPase of G3E family